MREWFDRMIAMRPLPSDSYISDILTEGARTEGIVGPDDSVSASSVRRTRIGRR